MDLRGCLYGVRRSATNPQSSCSSLLEATEPFAQHDKRYRDFAGAGVGAADHATIADCGMLEQ